MVVIQSPLSIMSNYDRVQVVQKTVKLQLVSCASPDERYCYLTTRRSTRGRISAQIAYPYINSFHDIEPDLLGMFET